MKPIPITIVHMALSLVTPFALVLASCSDSPDGKAGASAAETADGDAYPLTTCVVSGEELGGMGAPVVYDHNGTTVKFCCKSCIPKFEKDPEKYLAILNQP
ncbi:MAG: hypothetical protein R3F19_13585 [Verrucomicrobiales bacterium]